MQLDEIFFTFLRELETFDARTRNISGKFEIPGKLQILGNSKIFLLLLVIPNPTSPDIFKYIVAHPWCVLIQIYFFTKNHWSESMKF